MGCRHLEQTDCCSRRCVWSVFNWVCFSLVMSCMHHIKQNCFRTKQRTGNHNRGPRAHPSPCLSPRHLLLHCGVLSPPVLTLCLHHHWSLERTPHPPSSGGWEIASSPTIWHQAGKHPATGPLCTAVKPISSAKKLSKSIFTFLTSSAQDGFESIQAFHIPLGEVSILPKVIGSKMCVSLASRDEERSCLGSFPTSTWVPKTAYASFIITWTPLLIPDNPTSVGPLP